MMSDLLAGIKKRIRKLVPGAEGRPFQLVLSFYSPDGISYSMALASLSAYVKRHCANVEVVLVDINLTRDDLGDQSPLGFVERINKVKPDLICFSCMGIHWPPLNPYLKELKKSLPCTPVLIGGYQAILSPEETLEHSCVDFICVGDGEEPLVDLVNRIECGGRELIAGLWEKKVDGEIVKSQPKLTNDLSTLPYPDYTIFERDGKLDGLLLSILGIREDWMVLPVITGRGCPYKCTYCSNSTLLDLYKGKGRYLRKYNPESLVTELKKLRDTYHVDYFEFWDELFLFDMNFTYEFLRLYKQELGLPFSMTSRVETMDEPFCSFAKDAGCHSIWFGIESGSESYRHKYLKRAMTNEQIIIAADNARKAGIKRASLNMLGMPFESKEDMTETLNLNKIIKPEIFQFFPYMPLRGTELYAIAEREGLLYDILPGDFGSSARDGYYRMNLKYHPSSVTEEEFNQICLEFYKFQAEMHKLDFFSKN